MNEKLFLTKESGKSQIQMYFEGVRELVKTGKQFPVSIDDIEVTINKILNRKTA